MNGPLNDNLRQALLSAGPDGTLKTPYSTGRALKSRGYAEETGNRIDNGTAWPVMRMRLTGEGAKVAFELREQEIYEATHASVTAELTEMLQYIDPFDTARYAIGLVERIEALGMSSAGARAFRDVLQAHCRELVT